MGQKVNATIFRSGLKNTKWCFKYTDKNKEESSIFLYKNIEIQNYINKIFKDFNIFVKNCEIEHTDSTIKILITFFRFKNIKLYSSTSEKPSLLPFNQNNTKQLVSYIITKILILSTNLYVGTKTTIIKTQNLNKSFELKINKNLNYLHSYKTVLRSFKKFLKDPVQRNLIEILFITISENNSAKLLAESISFYLSKYKKKHNYLMFLLKVVITTLLPLNFSKTKGVKIVIAGRFNGAPRAKKKTLTIGVVPLQSFNSTISYHNTTSFTQNGTFGIKVWISEKIYIMFLQPKRSKFKKLRKGKLSHLEFKSNKLKFGVIGLKAAESGTITARQIEAARQSITRKINRKGKLWIRVFPSLPITLKPIEVRMGKGKGAVSFWASKISGGCVLFELCGVTKKTALAAFRTGGAKLPIKTQVFTS